MVRIFSEEHRAKISKANRGKIRTEEVNDKNRLGHLGKHHSEETKTKISKANKGKGHKAWNRGIPRTAKDKISIGSAVSLATKGNPKSQYAKDAYKRLWENPEHRDRQIKAQRAGLLISPNKPETILIRLAEIACPNEYKFTGDGKIVINGLCPDLFNKNSKKKVILMNGDYWHGEQKTGRNKQQEEQQAIDKYFEYGYDCLVIWEHELKDYENIVAKIREFNGKARIHHPGEIPIPNRQSNMFDMKGV